MDERQEIDRWIISKLHSLIKEVDRYYADYDATVSARKIQNFLDEHLSNWYVRLCRRRFWKGSYTTDKIAAYQTLYECMVAISKMMAPIAPFFAEWLFKNLNDVTHQELKDSVHLCDYPTSNPEMIDESLEERMEYAQRISSLVLSLRKKESLRVRQPLQKILLPVLNDRYQKQIEKVKDLIIAEVNIKEIKYITDTSGIINKKIKPNFKTLGRKLGKHMKSASTIIASLTQDDIEQIEKTNQYLLDLGEEKFELSLEDFEILSDDIPGWLVANDRDITVALDITLTDHLKTEGVAREIVNRIQNLRKQSDFQVTDRIDIKISSEDRIINSLDLFGDYIKNEVLANSITIEDNNGESVDLYDDLNINIKLIKS